MWQTEFVVKFTIKSDIGWHFQLWQIWVSWWWIVVSIPTTNDCLSLFFIFNFGNSFEFTNSNEIIPTMTTSCHLSGLMQWNHKKTVTSTVLATGSAFCQVCYFLHNQPFWWLQFHQWKLLTPNNKFGKFVFVAGGRRQQFSRLYLPQCSADHAKIDNLICS